MLQNGQYRPSRIASLEPLEQQTVTSQFNYGKNLHHKCKTPSTSFASQECTPTFQHTKPWKARMIGTATQWHLPVQRQSSTKIQTLERCGPHMAWMRGYLDPPKTTIGVIYTMSLKQKDTGSQDPLTCSPSNAWHLCIHEFPMSVSYPKNSRPILLHLIGQQEQSRS